MLQTGKQKMMKYCSKNKTCQNSIDIELLNIPECTYNYTEYQDGLVSDDFKWIVHNSHAHWDYTVATVYTHIYYKDTL